MKCWTPWKIALIASGVAASVWLWRYVDLNEHLVRTWMANATEDAMHLLAEDPLAMRLDTQQQVRLVAAATDVGLSGGPQAQYALALQYQRENNLEEAEMLLRHIIDEKPDWSWPYAQLGSLLGRGGPERLDEAETMLRQAIAIAPEWSRPYNSLGVTLRLMGRLEEAEDVAVYALELAPDDIAAHNNYANLLVTLGRFEEAETHYNYAAELEPTNPKPVYNLACLYSVMEYEDIALEYLEFALVLDDAIRRDAAVDPYFDNLRHLPRFQQLLYGDYGLADEPSLSEEAPAAEQGSHTENGASTNHATEDKDDDAL